MTKLYDYLVDVLDSSDAEYMMNGDIPVSVQEENGLVVTKVASHGGEGEGEDYWAVWEIKRGGEVTFARFEGFYSSYEGSTYEQMCEVTPRPVERIEYFAV
jgi:hypothetical protein